jgi:glucokinase
MGRAAAAEHPESLLVELAGGDPGAVRGPVVTEAARQGDPMAVEILSEVGRRLGEGIAGLVNVLDPELVVVGGGAAEAGELLLEPARRAFAESVVAVDHRPRVPLVAAELGNDAGAIGAADLAAASALDGQA